MTYLLDALRDGTLHRDADLSPYGEGLREAWPEAVRRYLDDEGVAA